MTRQTNFTQASVIGNASHEVEPSPFKTPDSIPRTLSDPKSETGDAKGKAQANAINLASEHKPGDASFGRAYARNASPDGETAAKKEEHSNNSGCVSPTDTNAVKTDGANNNGSTTNAGKKRKPGSSRGVANLTPHQLARKRANDREAQRAIRKRTKEQIESLERRVEELTSQRPYQDLQAALRERDNVLAENEEIRKRLASVLGIIQPILNASGLTEQQLANASQSLILTPNTNPSITPAAHNLPPPPFMPPITSSSHAQPLIAQDAATAAATGAAAGHIAPDPTSSTLPAMLGTPFQAPSLNSSGRGFATPSPPTSTTGPGNGAAMFATPSNWHSNELSPNQEQQNQQHQQQQQPAWSTCNFMDMKRRSLSQTLEFSADGERLGFNFLLDSSHRPGSGSGLGGFGAFSSSGSSGRTGTTPPEFSSRLDGEASSGLGTGLMSMRSGDLVSGFGTPQVPTTTVVPAATTTGATAAGTTRSSPSPSATGNLTIKNIPPTCPMDGILLDFLSSRRRKAAEGASSGQLVGPPYPSVSSLLNPENNTYSHPISQVFTEIPIANVARRTNGRLSSNEDGTGRRR
ncbi:hypothetical protein KEM55_007462 [Ascosphaera atra]|nr:hypothetical protein KEM55_007462 [Ascosphaera atra]